MPTPEFSPQLLGRTEKALNAILARLLAGTGVTEPQWVALTLTVSTGRGADLAARVAGALRTGESQARDRIAELVDAGWLARDGAAIAPTSAGRELHARVRAAVAEIAERLWGDLPAADLAAAARVLATIHSRADAELLNG